MTSESAMWAAIGAAISMLGSVLISIYASKQNARKDEVASLRAIVDELEKKYTKLLGDYRTVIDDLNNARGELALARSEVTIYHKQVIDLTTRVDVLNRRNQALESILREKGVEIPLEGEDIGARNNR